MIDRDLIWRLAAENRLKYGEASTKSVLGKVLASKPEYKSRIREVISVVEEVVREVNNEDLDRLRELIGDIGKRRKRSTEEFNIPELPNAVEGKVYTRFAPNPDFVLHLGSLRPLIYSYEYARRYRGRFYVRFEDTDPKTKRPEPEFYEGIRRDIEWLGIKPDKYVYQSDRLELYYQVARCLIRRGLAYVCLCTREEFKRYVSRGAACPHREHDVTVNEELFERILSGVYGEGEAVYRVKTDLNHPNPSVRDWAGLRIIDTSRYPHPRKGDKYIVWPLYNFSCAVDDHYMEISHVLRGSEHKVNEEKQHYIFRYMGWREPVYIHHGRVAIPEGILSKSRILKGIKEGLFSGVDDPRLATIAAFRRRGFHPKALYNVVLKTGLSTSITTIDLSMLYRENKRLIDKDSNRYFGVREPIEIEVYIPEDLKVSIRRHPDYPERGYRSYSLAKGVHKILIDVGDEGNLGRSFRLIGVGNFRMDGGLYTLFSKSVDEARRLGIPFIHWVLREGAVKTTLIYPDRIYSGYSEKYLLGEGVGRNIQFERLGYFKIEDIDGEVVKTIFTHP